KVVGAQKALTRPLRARSRPDADQVRIRPGFILVQYINESVSECRLCGRTGNGRRFERIKQRIGQRANQHAINQWRAEGDSKVKRGKNKDGKLCTHLKIIKNDRS